VVVLAGRLPKAVPFLVVAALLVAGLLIEGAAGGVVLLVLVVLLGSLLYLSWPALESGPRMLRLAVVLLVAVRALAFLAS
jgi:hypothetical protein